MAKLLQPKLQDAERKARLLDSHVDQEEFATEVESIAANAPDAHSAYVTLCKRFRLAEAAMLCEFHNVEAGFKEAIEQSILNMLIIDRNKYASVFAYAEAQMPSPAFLGGAGGRPPDAPPPVLQVNGPLAGHPPPPSIDRGPFLGRPP